MTAQEKVLVALVVVAFTEALKLVLYQLLPAFVLGRRSSWGMLR